MLFTIYMVFLYCLIPIINYHSKGHHLIVKNDIQSSSLLHICHHYNIDQLSSLIWSHRASILSSTSSSSLEVLLASGITNFDIDVSIINDNDIKRFIVAHPSQLSSSSSSSVEYISLSTFLDTIYDHMNIIVEQHEHVLKSLDDKDILRYEDSTKDTDTIPFITIEPKFNDDNNNLQELLNILMKSSLRNNVAIIASTTSIEKSLRKIITKESKIRIARAYRSIPLDYGHIWTNNINDNNKNGNDIRIIHMPDKVLVTSDIIRTKNDDQINTHNNEIVVSWLIDDEENMWNMFDKGVDAIITNKPIELLKILQETYQERC